MNRRLTTTLLAGLTLTLLAACGAPEPVKETSRTPMGLTINPNVVNGGEVGTSYSFTLNATGLKGRSELATFKWSFSGGASGEREVAIENGAATLDVAQAFDAAGVYGLVASVDTGARAATASAVISIGEAAPEREAELTTCGDWVTKQQGAYGVTIDRWDVSSAPTLTTPAGAATRSMTAMPSTPAAWWAAPPARRAPSSPRAARTSSPPRCSGPT